MISLQGVLRTPNFRGIFQEFAPPPPNFPGNFRNVIFRQTPKIPKEIPELYSKANLEILLDIRGVQEKSEKYGF